MKKVILFSLLLVFSFLSVNAQRINDDGKKVVSKIVVERYNHDGVSKTSRTTYNFTYTEDLKLMYLEMEKIPLIGGYVDTERRTLLRKGNELIRKDYINGKIAKYWSYEYRLNNMGRIVKRMRYNYTIDNSYVSRIDSEIKYEDTQFIVSTCTYYKGRNDKVYSKVTDDIVSDDRCFYFEDGNAYYKRTQICRYGTVVDKYNWHLYSDYVNDTNVNFNQFFTQYAWDRNPDEFEFLTEWCGMASKNLLSSHKKSYFKYTFDEKDNVIGFTVHNKYNDRITFKYTIQYLH